MNYRWILFAMFGLLFIHSNSQAQLSQYNSSIFFNKIQFNPSQAGILNHARVNLTVKTPLDNSQPGLSSEYNVTGDMPISETAAIGVTFQQQKSGILKSGHFGFAYAYGMKIKENLNLRLGIGAGLKNKRVTADINSAGIIGDEGDPALFAYNNSTPVFNSKLSFSLYTKSFEIQGVLPDATSKIQRNTNESLLDQEAGQFAVAYTKEIKNGGFLPDNSVVKVHAGFLKYKQTGSIISAGLLFTANHFISASCVYNSQGIISAWLNIPLEDKLNISFYYSTGGVYSRSIYGGAGVAELHFSYSFKKSKHEEK